MERSTDTLKDFGDFITKSFVAISGNDKSTVVEIFGKVSFIEGDEVAFVTEAMSEKEAEAKISALTEKGISVKSRIRLL